MRTHRISPAALLCAALLAIPAAAQHTPSNPGCAYNPIDVEKYGKKPFQNPPEIRAANGRLQTNLVVRYTDPATTSLGGCPLTLRSYNGALVGPTLRVKPGDVMVPWLDNRLPAETEAEIQAQFEQEAGVAFLDMRPYSFNTTNLHTHGLHVSPSGNSDNVLLAISPQTRFQYRIALPADHTRGTYWYHAHTHGSTAIQVGSAMAGALVVDDDPARIPAALRAANAREKVMVIQTILYDTAGKSENIQAFFPDPGSGRNQACVTGGTSCTWQGSNRHVTINGQIVPVIHMAPGEVQRWRMVDGSFRETMAIRLEGHALHEIATDGIYTGRIDTWPDGEEILLYPGYRSDVLVQAGRPGTYRLLDDSAGVAQSLKGVAEDPNVLAIVIVDDVPRMDMRLPTQAEMAALDPFPGVNLAATATGVQEAVFKLGSGLMPTDPRNSFQINYAAFNETRTRYLELDSIDMWSLTTVGDPAAVQNGNGVPPLPHVFHIHINPFQVFRSGPNGQPQMVWKDTQFIPAGETVNVYTQYLDYTGSFVIHCHILDHEDLGMMETVEVVREMPRPHPRPNTSSGAAAHGHGSH
ncbi:multicopper oxidase family protein [Longimicrobium sp.]|uniref:multicopper oxidase family protein n=1 Tax=Longimicrobium sp. TaxID=2029185 RepID=UPI003B3A4892